MNTKVSLARSADAAAIAEMSRTLIEDGLPWSWDEQRVRRYIAYSESAVIVARSRHRLAGFAIMEFLDQHAHLSLLAVRPGFRRQGVGTSLVHWLEACARTAGLFDVRLELRVSNVAARKFYADLGFSDCGLRHGYYAGVEDAHRMNHDLRMTPTSRA